MAANQNSGTPAAKSTPRDALVMAAVLKEMGISEYEPRVVNQLLEYTYRYITTVLDDARVYCSHAGKKDVDADDVKLAIQSRLDHSYTNPPPRDFLIEIARQKNRTPLPLIQPKSGLRLPPDRYCLTATNYKIKTQKKVRSAVPITSRTLSQSNTSTLSTNMPSKSVPTTPVTVRPPTSVLINTSTQPVNISATPISSTTNTTVIGTALKQEPGMKIVSTSHTPSTGVTIISTQSSVKQAVSLPGIATPAPSISTASTCHSATVTASGQSILTVSALPSMDETVASTQKPLIMSMKRKHEDEDDDYDV